MACSVVVVVEAFGDSVKYNVLIRMPSVSLKGANTRARSIATDVC